MRIKSFRIDNHGTIIIDMPHREENGYGVHEEVYQREYVLMQFTNLKDINGKEIYEKDILRNPDLNGWFSGPEKFLVEFGNGYYKYFEGFKESEVIGNIYENPDLLINQG